MDSTQLVRQGFEQLALGRVEDAGLSRDKAMRAAPDDPTVRLLACEVALSEGKHDEALKQIAAAIQLEPREPGHRFRKAQILNLLRRGIEAQKTAGEAAAIMPEHPGVQAAAAAVFLESGNHVAAAPLFRKARQLGADDANFSYVDGLNHYQLAGMADTAGSFAAAINAAESCFNEALIQAPSNGSALLMRARLRPQTRETTIVDSLRMLCGQKLSHWDAIQVRYALAKELDDLGEHKEAFDALEAASTVRRQILAYNYDEELDNLEGIVGTITPQAYASIPASMSAASPVFILGLPCSGVSFLERVIGVHAQARSAGESPDFARAMSETVNAYLSAHGGKGLTPVAAALRADYSAMAQRYLKAVEAMIGPSQRFIDRTPLNSLYCGLIHKAFPRSPIIHVSRDALDTCWALYKTLFPHTQGYSYRLSELADYYIAHHRLMQHWRKLAPNAIIDVTFERLLADPLGEARRVVQACGLSFNAGHVEKARFLLGHDAVDHCQPGAWRNYERKLTPLREKLQSAGVL